MLGTARHRFVAFLLSSTSVGSLLAYFQGWGTLRDSVLFGLLPSAAALVLLAAWCIRGDRADLGRRIVAGVWIGIVATFAYDIVRLPLAYGGIPVFKAISYFGTVLAGAARPDVWTEVVGWSYHLSNGIGFAIMYLMLAQRPKLWSAVLWGLLLEAVMLVTPYAEVFGYKRGWSFLAISIGGHVAYGVGLWWGARRLGYCADTTVTTPRLVRWSWLAPAIGLAGIGLVAVEFHRLHASTIPASPPPYIGPHLYVTWNVGEPDRVGAIWLMKRHVDPNAVFHFVEPMSQVRFGTAFDIPEADIRRTQDRSTFEEVLTRLPGEPDAALKSLASFCRTTELSPWLLASRPEDQALAASFATTVGECKSLSECLDPGLRWFDETYARLSRGEAGGVGPAR